MRLKYCDRIFTSAEEVEAYDRELFKKWRASNYKDNKISDKINEFKETIGHYILDLLRTLTIDLDPKKFDESAKTDEEIKKYKALRCQIQNDVIGLGKRIDFWYEWRFDEDMSECDLIKSYAIMSYYYRDYKDKTLFFKLNCTDSPYEPWYNYDYTFSAVRRKPIVTYTYLDYNSEEVEK